MQKRGGIVLGTLAVGMVLSLATAMGMSERVPAESREMEDVRSETVAFTKTLLYQDANEGTAIADVNNDGTLDIIAGRNWYAGPDFLARPLRLIDDWNGYVQSNGDHVYDVNGDGWADVVAGSFLPTEVHWYENPGADGLAKGVLWPEHLLTDTEASTNEITFLRDVSGDPTPEWVVNSWDKQTPLVVWQFATDADGAPSLEKAVLGTNGHGHGMGFGDVNGDGREDILVGTGWYERPADGDPLRQAWTYHPDWDLHASVPMLLRDLDGDGRNDLIWGKGHDIGLYWWQQLEPAPDGTTRWKEHRIDDRFSQPHALHWADLDGDGQDELITGKRKWAHNGNDPGGDEPPVLFYYEWNPQALAFTRHEIDVGRVGTGLQIRTADMNRDGRTDIVVAGKSGTYLLTNEGRPE